MDSDQDYSSSRIPRPIETAAMAIGIALFVVFTFVGFSQAGDRKAVTGNKQEQQSAHSDTETTMGVSNALIGAAAVKDTKAQDFQASHEQPEKHKQARRQEAIHKSNDKAADPKSVRLDAIQKRAKVE